MGNCCRAVSDFIWKNLEELTEFEHCKPAPFVSHRFLMFLRIFVSLCLLALSITIIIVTNFDSLKYFSEWALYAATILYAVMAYVQVKTQQSIEDFTLDVTREKRDSWIQDDLEREVETRNIIESTGWKWIIFFYQMCFVCCLLASTVFWVTFASNNHIYNYSSQ